MKENKWTWAIAALMLVLASCNTKPSDDTAREAFAEMVKNESDGKLTLTDNRDFAKLNSFEKVVDGQATYVYEFGARLVANGVCYKEQNTFMSQGPFPDFRLHPKPVGYAPNHVKVYSNARVGCTGELYFVKKDNGWSLNGYSIKHSEIESNPNPLEGVWKLTESPVNIISGITQILVQDGRFAIYSDSWVGTQTFKLVGDELSGTYNFPLGESGRAARFRGTVDDNGTRLILSIDIPSSAEKSNLVFTK